MLPGVIQNSLVFTEGYLLEQDFFCKHIIDACENSNYKIDEMQELPLGSVEHVRPKGDKIIKAVQFTDAHLDLDYVTGAEANCQNVLCCRQVIENPEKPA